jgi:hypothetical protein
MIAGISIKHILENALRVDLDDHGYGDVDIHNDDEHAWVLYRDGNLVGKASYDLNNIFIEIKG